MDQHNGHNNNHLPVFWHYKEGKFVPSFVFWHYKKGSTVPMDVKQVMIDQSVTSIPPNTFAGCKQLQYIHFGSALQLQEIGECAFADCVSLCEANLPPSLTKIERSAFSGCAKLERVWLPNGLTYIGHWAFSGCVSLPFIHIPGTIVKIKNNVFDGCQKLASAVVGEGIVVVGYRAFSRCGLQSLVLPHSTLTIVAGAFYQTDTLRGKVTFQNEHVEVEEFDAELWFAGSFCQKIHEDQVSNTNNIDVHPFAKDLEQKSTL